MVLVLCDSYYNDIKVSRSTTMQRGDIDETVMGFKRRWSARAEQQKVFKEDDVLDIQEYIYEKFSSKAGTISDLFLKKFLY